jgi:DNA polymerase-3 subunit delta'
MEIKSNAPLLAALKDSTAYHMFEREAEHPSHAYILISEDTVACEQLLTLLCLKVYCPKVCLTCAECRKVLGHNKPDIYDANPKGDAIQVEKVQDLIDDAQMGSYEDCTKIYIIRNMHLQRERVQNLLLKTLEEPHDNVLFLLTAEHEKGILPTVLSRVKSLNLTPFEQSQLVDILQAEGVNAPDTISKAAMGNVTLAMALGTDEHYFTTVDEVVDLLAEMKRVVDVPRYIYLQIFGKDNLPRSLDVLEIAIKDIMLVKNGLEQYVIYRNKLSIYRQIADGYPVRSLPMILDIINEAKLKVASYCTAVNIADSMLLGILEVKNICAQ